MAVQKAVLGGLTSSGVSLACLWRVSGVSLAYLLAYLLAYPICWLCVCSGLVHQRE